MSIISDLFGGGDAADAAMQAANVQEAATTEGIKAQKEALANIRADLAPFREAGAAQLPALSSGIADFTNLSTNPQAQASWLQSNPFYGELAKNATSSLFANQAAKGKLGSGGTAKALQNSILLLGNDLLNQDLSRRGAALGQNFNMATMGQNAAAMTGTQTQNATNNISNLMQQGANATASGIVGAANAQNSAMSTGLNFGLGAAGLYMLSDRRAKDNIVKIGTDDLGLPVYEFTYKGDDLKRIGHIAQDVEAMYPAAVKEFGGFKFIDYGVLNHAA